MKSADLNSPDFEYDDTDPEGFRAGVQRLGPALGAKATGASLYEIPAKQALCPYHYEYGEEEWVLVLEGTATIRTPEGEQSLSEQQMMFFPAGPDGAHQVRNDGDATLRVLMWSSVVFPNVTVYPDSDKVGVWTGRGNPDNLMVPRSAKVDYYLGEV